jgi:hypothetical protein
MSIFDRFTRTPGTPQERFWAWFQKNEGRLFDIEKDLNQKFAELRRALDAFHDGLAFEFGPVIDGRRDFVISADGIKSSFPFVESLVAAAPQLPRWNVIKFRPARQFDAPFRYEGITAESSHVEFSIHHDADKPAITLYFKNYDDALSKQFLGLTFLLLDNFLGEYNVALKVGEIRTVAASESVSRPRLPLTELPDTFDRLIKARTN